MPKTVFRRSKRYKARASAAKSVLSPASTSRAHRSVAFQNTITQQTNSEEVQKLQMRWCFFWICFAFCILWMIGIISTSIIIFCMTKNFLSFFISAGIALPGEFIRRFANYLLPMDDKRYELERMKIQKGYRTWRQWLSNPK